MSGRYRVEWSAPASGDLESIVAFIERDRPQVALEILERFRRTVARLETSPQSGRMVAELKECGVNLYRELILTPWRIVYRIAGRHVWVMAVVDGRRDLEDVLLDRFSRE